MMRRSNWLGVLCALSACNTIGDDGASDDEEDATVSEPAIVGDAGLPAVRRDASVASFGLNLEASSVDLCAGSCSDLKAVPRNASGAVSYAWDDGLPASATQHVCPTTTHTYHARATVRAAGEFAAEQQADDGLTINVRDCSAPKADDGVMCELRHRFDWPRSGDLTYATKPWVNLDAFGSPGPLEVGPDGRAYLIGTFAQQVDFGTGVLEADAPVSGFLLTIDANCKPLRTQLLSATSKGDTLVPAAMAVDAQGDVYVSSVAGRQIDFNIFAPSPVRWTTELLIEKFSPSGESLWRYSIPTLPGGFITDIEVDAQGRAFIAGMAPDPTDLGAGLPIGPSLTTHHTFLLALTADGRYGAHRLDTGATDVELGRDRVFSPGYTPKSYDLLSGWLGVPTPNETPALTALAGTDLSRLWSLELPSDSEGYLYITEGLANGALAMLLTKDTPLDANTISSAQLIKRFDPNGRVTSNTAFLTEQVPAPEPVDGGIAAELGFTTRAALAFERMHESEPGALALAGSYYGDHTIAGASLKGGEIKMFDAFTWIEPRTLVAKVSADDRLLWARAQNWGKEIVLHGLTSSATGEVLIAGQGSIDGADADGDDVEWDVVIRKLRAN
jgi:hypothetical protein